MIDPATGTLTFDDGTSLGPLAVQTQGEDFRGRAKHASGGLFFLVEACFEDDRLARISLTQVDADFDPAAPKSWDGWSAEKETATQRSNEEWLARSLGPPHESFTWGSNPDGQRYRFPWGQIESCYSPQTGGTSLVIAYIVSP